VKERDFISKIRKQFGGESDLLFKGIGDDCAVFRGSDDLCWLISTDLLVENVHFVLEWHDAYLLGRKAVAVNLSDIAAMGGRPRFIAVSLALPSYLSDDWLNHWYRGVADTLNENNCLLIGGDVAKSALFTINIIALGSAHPDKVVYRNGAKEEDDIYVTGLLGSAAAGLELLQRKIVVEDAHLPFITAHLNPEPQVSAGIALAESGFVSAMQDISDGVATDLSHICLESQVGAVVYASELPCFKELPRLCEKYHLSLNDIVLSGGEDYQLIFTADVDHREKLAKLGSQLQMSFSRIGRITAQKGRVFLEEDGVSRDITFRGFEHDS
jgi:thiamine-monophosphate kinase